MAKRSLSVPPSCQAGANGPHPGLSPTATALAPTPTRFRPAAFVRREIMVSRRHRPSFAESRPPVMNHPPPQTVATAFARGLIVAVAGGAFLAVTGAFGTSGAPFGPRLAYWVAGDGDGRPVGPPVRGAGQPVPGHGRAALAEHRGDDGGHHRPLERAGLGGDGTVLRPAPVSAGRPAATGPAGSDRDGGGDDAERLSGARPSGADPCPARPANRRVPPGSWIDCRCG